MLIPEEDDGYRVAKLEQKSAILRNSTLVAYAGRRDIALPVFRKLAKAVVKRQPSRDLIQSVLERHTKSLEGNDTSVLVAFVEGAAVEILEFGHQFESVTLEDGTECRAVGSGTEALFDLLSTIMAAEGRSDTAIPEYHMRVMKLLGHMAEVHAGECITGKFHNHFGGIMEMIRSTQAGFEKFPGATFAIELLRLRGDQAVLLGEAT